MTPENFCYWLQGLFEHRKDGQITLTEIKSIRDHLALVFTKVTPEQAEGSKQTPLPSLNTCMKDYTTVRGSKDKCLLPDGHGGKCGVPRWMQTISSFDTRYC
jgi:hypothetical protein